MTTSWRPPICEVVETGAGIDATWQGREVIINSSSNWGDDERAQDASFQILGLPRDGTYAELVSVPVEQLHEKPECEWRRDVLVKRPTRHSL